MRGRNTQMTTNGHNPNRGAQIKVSKSAQISTPSTDAHCPLHHRPARTNSSIAPGTCSGGIGSGTWIWVTTSGRWRM